MKDYVRYSAHGMTQIGTPTHGGEHPLLSILRYQGEFKVTHKQVDQIRNHDLRPGELRAEIGQLEDEKKQLTEKIDKLKGNVTDEPGEHVRDREGERAGRVARTSG